MPMANAEVLCRCEGRVRMRLTETFSMLPVGSALALGNHWRHDPKRLSKKNRSGRHRLAQPVPMECAGLIELGAQHWSVLAVVVGDRDRRAVVDGLEGVRRRYSQQRVRADDVRLPCTGVVDDPVNLVFFG